MEPGQLLSIGAVAARLGTTTSALRHYDRLDLYKPAVVEADRLDHMTHHDSGRTPA